MIAEKQTQNLCNWYNVFKFKRRNQWTQKFVGETWSDFLSVYMKKPRFIDPMSTSKETKNET